MNLARRLDKIETSLGSADTDAGLSERLNRMRHENIVTGMQKFGFSETDARRYADLVGEGIAKYGQDLGSGGWMSRFRIENWRIVPIDIGG